jgi:hypothetical protein
MITGGLPSCTWNAALVFIKGAVDVINMRVVIESERLNKA